MSLPSPRRNPPYHNNRVLDAIQMLRDDMHREIDEVKRTMNEQFVSRREYEARWQQQDKSFEDLAGAVRSQSDHLQTIKQDVSAIRADLPVQYVRRDDYRHDQDEAARQQRGLSRQLHSVDTQQDTYRQDLGREQESLRRHFDDRVIWFLGSMLFLLLGAVITVIFTLHR